MEQSLLLVLQDSEHVHQFIEGLGTAGATETKAYFPGKDIQTGGGIFERGF